MPVDISVLVADNESFHGARLYRDVEKLVFVATICVLNHVFILKNGDKREMFLRIWAEVAGVARPGLGNVFDKDARIALIYERSYLGLPRSSLPVVLFIFLLIMLVHFILVPFFMKVVLCKRIKSKGD